MMLFVNTPLPIRCIAVDPDQKMAGQPQGMFPAWDVRRSSISVYYLQKYLVDTYLTNLYTATDYTN